MILLDVHPATVQLPDGQTIDRARAVLTTSTVRVWEAVGRDAVLVLDVAQVNARIDARHPAPGVPVLIPTAAGEVTVTRLRGCGCGSPLKALRPSAD